MAEAVVEAAEGYSCSLLRQLWQMRTQGQMTDLTIHTRDGGIIPCHANVMAAASEYFRQLLNTPDLNKEIQLNFEEGHVLSIVEYCYKGRLTLTIAAAESHLRIADDFHLHELKQSIEEFLCENVTPQSSLEWYSLAKEFKLDRLRKKCQRIAAVPRKPQTPAAAVPRKPKTPAAAVPRKPATPRNLSMILVGGFNQKNVLNRKLWNIELKSGKIKGHEMDRRVVKYAPAYCSTPNRIFVIGGSKTKIGKKFAPLSDCLAVSASDCETWPNVLKPLADGVAAVCVDDAIYAFSDYANDQAVYRLDLKTKQWTRCPNMPTRMMYPIIVNIRNRVFVIFNTTPYNDKFKSPGRVAMFSFDTNTLQWQTLKPLPASIPDTCSAQAVRVEEDFYLVGGEEKLCARYSPLHNTWQTLSEPLLVHQAFSACHLDGTIVLCGGTDEYGRVHDTIETYDIARNTWAIHRFRMPMELKCHHVVAFDEEKGEIVL